MPFFEGAGGQVNYRIWPARGTGARLEVLLAHGRGQHSALYHHVARRLVAAEMTVYGIDLTGHGLSEGESATADAPTAAIDLQLMSDLIGRPRAIVGHSLGAAAAIASLVDGVEWDVVVLSGTPARALLPDALDRLESTRTLFVHGADDRMTPLAALREAIGDRPLAVEVFADAGHDLFHEPVERRVTDRIIDFLNTALG